MKIEANKVYKLKGVVQHYAWGGTEYIPQLLEVDNAAKTPFAEYWMGAHASAPSLLENNDEVVGLNKLIAEEPSLLGKEVENAFHQLPYLFKVLDVKEMLSIQVHPSKEEAEKGFAEEEARGVPINAPNRNYKDKNHKPEVMIALSDFWLLHGFKPVIELKQVLSNTLQFRSLGPIFDDEGYEGLYSYVMELPQQEVDAMLLPLVQQEVKRRAYHESEKNEPGYWVGEYYLNKQPKNIDKGVFSIYFFNLVHLQPGQGIFQAAGIPHAYLHGQNVELMANSDNVLRGGLTNKHIDVPELMKHIKFEAVAPYILTGNQSRFETVYNCPVDDFTISKIDLPAKEIYTITATSPQIVICINGSAIVDAANQLTVKKGEVFIAFAGTGYSIKAEENCLFFSASVPLKAYQQAG